MSERQKREHCVGILSDEVSAALGDEPIDESNPIGLVAVAFRRMDRPAVLRILVRTKPSYRPDMAGFVVHHRPDLNEYVNNCLEYLGRGRGG